MIASIESQLNTSPGQFNTSLPIFLDQSEEASALKSLKRDYGEYFAGPVGIHSWVKERQLKL